MEHILFSLYILYFDTGVCMAKHESNYNIKAKNSKNCDGTNDYGLFYVNNKWWCSYQKYPSKHGCNISKYSIPFEGWVWRVKLMWLSL